MKLYLKYFLMSLKSQMQYKVSLCLATAGQFLVSFSVFFGIWFMFSRFRSVEGFTLPQVLLCYAVVLMAFSIAEWLGRGLIAVPRMLGNGEFDRMLVRPRHEIYLVICAQTDFTRLGMLLQAVLMFCYAIPQSGVLWTWDKILTLFLMITCGSVVFMCLWLFYACISFFTVEGLEFMNILTYGGRDHGRYPFSIYGKGVLSFLTFVIPLALFQYYPLLYLLDKSDNVLYMLTPVLSLLFCIPSYAFWRFGLRRYKSTGS
jgi:ABC-2 type transport system permease protein